MEKWKIDVPVLCIFFARPEQFAKSFETVRKAKPSKLLLWQDGAREGREDDIENIEKCRKIAQNIDWECEVYKNYHDKNMGCDPSTHLSHKWAFSIVDKCIILEDDIVPSQSFFVFCKQLLDYYENDTRVDRICGQTLFSGVPDKRYSYFFAKSGSSWGWAGWKRTAQLWQSDYAFLQDPYYMDLAEHRAQSPIFKQGVKKAKRHAKEGKPYWEDIVGFSTTLNSGLVIYPSVNMIENVGTSENATHAPDNIAELPKKIQEFFLTRAEEIEFPLKHPPYVIEDYHYIKKVLSISHPNFWGRNAQRIEHLYRKALVRLKKKFFANK